MNSTKKQNAENIAKLMEAFQEGKLTSLELGQQILAQSIASQGSLTLDLDRKRRCGFPEVVYGSGKSTDTLVAAIEGLLRQDPEVLVTRVIPEQVRVLSERFPLHRWNHRGGTFRVGRDSIPLPPESLVPESLAPESLETVVGRVAVVSAGTTDEPVALEAQETLAWMGVPSLLLQDLGVAGPYRLLANVPILQQMSAIVCVAGMEGALPSVLGGHVRCPIIAVPTSVGYGANFAGLAALLSMLNACAANIAVVNIDAGFKGGYLAGLIARAGLRLET